MKQAIIRQAGPPREAKDRPPKPKPKQPLKWPDILANDPQHAPTLRICESCPNFSVRRDGCPACSLFKGCAKLGKFGNAIIKREWPPGCPQRAV